MITVAADAPPWAHELARRVELEIREQAMQPVFLPVFTAVDLPLSGTNSNRLIYISDESGGAVPAFSDGVNWRRCTDRAVVS